MKEIHAFAKKVWRKKPTKLIVKNMKTLVVHERKRVFILNSRKW